MLEQHVIFVLLWAWNNEKTSKPLMGFKSMREELIVTKAGLGHLLEEKRQRNPNITVGAKGSCSIHFTYPGLGPYLQRARKLYSMVAVGEKLSPAEVGCNLLFGAQAKAGLSLRFQVAG